MLDDKELIRRALMGDKQAQKECTEKGIVLPCPCCGRPMEMVSNGFAHTNTKCILNLRYFKFTDTELISLWNTRPAPPVGRCGECKYFNHFFNAVGHCMIHSQEKDSFGDGYRVEMLKTDFCSYFEPRED